MMDARLYCPLDGFDLDLVGFDCAAELEAWDEFKCPFNPGCGGKPGTECPLMKQRAQILLPPKRWQ